MARKSRKRNRKSSPPKVAEPALVEIKEKSLDSHPSTCDLLDAEPSAADEPAESEPTSCELADSEPENLNAENKPLDDAGPGDTESTNSNDPVIEAIAANTALIQQLLDQVGQAPQPQPHEPLLGIANEQQIDHHSEQLEDEVAELRHRNDEQAIELQRRQSRIEELIQQTEDLAAQIAESGVRQTVATNQSCTGDALSWDERKLLILQQLESDTFDADAFVESIAEEINAQEEQSPEELLDELVSRLQRSESELAERKIEIGELRILLDQQSGTRDGGVAIGAAAIAQMVDSDELVMQERERLQTLQDQWEEKFRQSEIEASLERAKLSRERQELAKKSDQLEEELEHLRREAKQEINPVESGTSRRWLAKLGLSDAD